MRSSLKRLVAVAADGQAIPAANPRDLGDGPVRPARIVHHHEPLVVRLPRLGADDAAVLGLGGRLHQPPAHLGVAQARALLVERTPAQLAPLGQPVEGQPCLERQHDGQ